MALAGCCYQIVHKGTNLAQSKWAVIRSKREVRLQPWLIRIAENAMKIQFYLFTIFLGIILAVHLAMNGKVGSALGNPRVGNAVFWCIGAATAVLIGFTGWRSGVLNGFKDVHPLLLTAGALGACLVFAIAWLLPQVGARAMFITLIAGQVLGGMILSHFGWFGSPVQRITIPNLVGAAIMIGGVALATHVTADA
jgi:transporter family-2 protein